MRTSVYSMFFLLLCAGSHLAACAQDDADRYNLKREDFESKLTSLREEFGKNKSIPPDIELECLAALSFYPELTNTEISFRFHKIHFTMTSKPRMGSLLRQKTYRKYIIELETPGYSKNHVEWKDLTFNALVGWIGHELGHIVHYSHKSGTGIILVGVKYAFPAYRRKMERFTDQLAIQHDLGYALLEGVVRTLKDPAVTERYKQVQKKYYLQPEEITARINSKDSWSTVFRKTKMKFLAANQCMQD